MHNLLIRTRLIGFCLLGILLAALIGLVGYWSGEKQSSALADVAVNFSALRNHLESDMMHDALRADVLAALRAGSRAQRPADEDRAIRDDLQEHAATFRKNLAENERLALDAEVRNAINDLRPALDTYIRSAEATVARALQGESQTDADFAAFMTSFEALEKDMAAVSDLIETSTTEARDAAGRAATTARLAIVGATLAGMLLLALLSMLLTRSILRPLRRLQDSFDDLKQGQGDLTTRLPVAGSDEIARITAAFNTFLGRLHDMVLRIKHSSETVATTSDTLSGQSKQATRRATQVADRIMQVSAATEEISVAVSEVAHNVHEVSQAAGRAARVAADGKHSMADSVAMSTAMVEAVKVSVARIDELGGSVKKIGGIAQIIKEIAEQTNLLALNAAIEAARAGEQGRGFAIVADEVRKLAERTATSTADITTIIGTIRDSATGAVTAMARLEGQVTDGARQLAVVQGTQEQIGTAAEQVTGLAQEIADAAKQQSTAVDNAAGNMEQVSTLSEETSAVIAAMDQAAAGLHDAADQLKRLVTQFTVHEANA